MTKHFLRFTIIVLQIPGIALFFSSCTYKDIVDVPYPDQVIYMSEAAVANLGPNANGIYTITPNVQGQVYRYVTDAASGKVNVLLGVIRSGIDISGTVPVNVTVNTDTIAKLISAGKLAAGTQLLPSTAYTLPASINIEDGKTSSDFFLSVDLNVLKNDLTKKYAIAVAIITNIGKTVKPTLGTTVIFIDPSQVLLPVANFTTYVYTYNKTANFRNISANGINYSWDFGDGSALSPEVSPGHVYAASGSYMVKLTATSVTGAVNASVKNATVIIP